MIKILFLKLKIIKNLKYKEKLDLLPSFDYFSDLDLGELTSNILFGV